MSDTSAPPAPPAAAKSPSKKEGGLPWGIPLLILAFCIALAVGIPMLYENRRAFEWFKEYAFALVIPLAIGFVVIFLLTRPGAPPK